MIEFSNDQSWSFMIEAYSFDDHEHFSIVANEVNDGVFVVQSVVEWDVFAISSVFQVKFTKLEWFFDESTFQWVLVDDVFIFIIVKDLAFILSCVNTSTYFFHFDLSFTNIRINLDFVKGLILIYLDVGVVLVIRLKSICFLVKLGL